MFGKRDPFSLHSPYESVERARRARLVDGVALAVIWSSAASAVLYAIIWVFQHTWQFAVPVGTGVLSTLIGLQSRTMVKRDKLEGASYILIISMLIMVAFTASVVTGVTEVIAPGYAALVVVSGMILSSTGVYIITFVAFLMWLAQLILIEAGLFTPQPLPGGVMTFILVAITALVFFFIAWTSQLATRDLRQALGDATYDLVQANRELDKASKLKSQFMARTSHELRTPLNSIIGFTDLALREIYGPLTSLQQDGFKRVLGNAKRLLALINDILDLSKIEAGELELYEDRFTVSNLVETVDAALGAAARKKKLDLSLSISNDMPAEIIGDESRLSQILVNLVDNAIKFTDEGEVKVSIERANTTQWRMKVQDSGRGIHEENFERIFEDFRQAEAEVETPNKHGTGLGLAIARHLAEMMEGKIYVKSRIGQGSTFEVVLPLKESKLASTSPEKTKVVA